MLDSAGRVLNRYAGMHRQDARLVRFLIARKIFVRSNERGGTRMVGQFMRRAATVYRGDQNHTPAWKTLRTVPLGISTLKQNAKTRDRPGTYHNTAGISTPKMLNCGHLGKPDANTVPRKHPLQSMNSFATAVD